MRSNSTNKDLKGFHGLIKIKIRADFFKLTFGRDALLIFRKILKRKRRGKKRGKEKIRKKNKGGKKGWTEGGRERRRGRFVTP